MGEWSTYTRRNFLKTGTAVALTAALEGIPFFVKGSDQKKIKLTILHTNDWHSRIEPFPAGDKKYSGLGGAEARAVLIRRIRSEEEHVLLLDAGDIFQGTPYFNFYGGELEYKLMSAMQYDCITLGNHDFDNGIDGLLKQLPHATFGLVNCNYDFSATKLAKVVSPYKIIEKGPLKIGITGVGIELSGLVPDRLFENIEYRNPVEHANRIAHYLKVKERCDLVICLSHLGFDYPHDKISDQRLAAHSENIDLIIGGHTHTFLDRPVSVLNRTGKPVLINQVGWAGINLGRIDFSFDKHHRSFLSHQSTVHPVGQLL